MNTIKFVLDNEIKEIDFQSHSPTTTVLNYLRDLSNHKGVKEGCAEGDCGACTVVIASMDAEGQLHYEACDSCLIFLPMLQGKQLITVENLAHEGKLHPVQQSMVDTDGSQCGYCTPGFIMSLFALYKNHDEPNRAVIDDALTGNLCRCTGYRPIIDAAVQSCTQKKADAQDQFNAMEAKIKEKLKQIRQTNDLTIQNKEQVYYKPATLDSALHLRKIFPEALLVTGATDLGLRVTKNNEVLPLLIDISGLKELKKLESHADGVVYGSGLSLEKVKNHSEENHPALFETLKVFGSLQIRNLATLGGNIGSASPIGDTPPTLMAYDASIELQNAEGSRKIKMMDFITGYRQTQIKEDEIIIAVHIPKIQANEKVKWYKISKRKDLDISTVSAGFKVQLDSNQKVNDIRLVYGGMAAMTKRAEKAETFLMGKTWTRENIETAMPLIDEAFTPISDARASAAGRAVMARNLLLKFWTETSEITV